MTIQQHRARVAPTQQPTRTRPQENAPGKPKESQGASFADHLKKAGDGPDVSLSAHAKQRLAQRGISLDATERQALSDAVQQLDAKGARDAAVMRRDAAFVVNVPSRTVVTALDQSEMQQRVFTQIDSAMMLS